MKININKYANFIFDADGTIFNSNFFKRENVFCAAKKFVTVEVASAFAKYFIESSGIPREIKISSFFSEDLAPLILSEYNKLNKLSLNQISLTGGVREVLAYLSRNHLKVVLCSGGDRVELDELMRLNNLYDVFDLVICGKDKNDKYIEKFIAKSSALYFGDSWVDFSIANNLLCDFIYVNGYITSEMRLANNNIRGLGVIHSFCDLELYL